jgi:endo-1,4-beta-xylanase
LSGSLEPGERQVMNPVDVIPRRSTIVSAIDDPVVSRAVSFITEHATRRLSLASVARAASCSRQRLEQRFRARAAIGRTVMQEVQRARVDVARRLLSSTLDWTSSGPILAPLSDATHDLVAIKDPTVVFYQDRWHVYASSVSTSGVYGMVYLNFADFSDPSSLTFYHMDQTPGFDTYVAAPQLFHFGPRNEWYLVFQSGPPMFSTNDDPGNPGNWTPPAAFYSSEPAIVAEDGWLDFWVICDEQNCHMFFSNDHGRWYRSTTSVADFPNGFGDPVVVMEDAEAGRLFEASNVYRLGDTGGYLALIEAYDSTSNWRRYFRSFTADSLDGPWAPFLDSGGTPFAGPSNVAFDGEAWTDDISHGELVRAGYDQSLTLDPCDLRFLYQGFDPNSDTTNYNAIPWRLGLLTKVP